MSRITKWKFEQTKVKVVFRLQFHATHIPQAGWDKLFITFVPADSGKATAKTSKANVRNGTCKWADPIYETTRLLQDSKTKQYEEKIYKLVVAMGSSRSSVLGEATIDLAHYADALKPYVVALPLQGCDNGSTLHVTVQLLTSKTGFREFEQQRELRERGLQSTSDASAARRISSYEDTVNGQLEKASSRVRFKEELHPLVQEMGLNEDCADSAVGFDGSSNTSESLYAEKHVISSIHEIDNIKSTFSDDLVGLSLSQSPQLEKGDPSNPILLPQGSNDWSHGWGSDYSADHDLVNAYEENSRLRGSLEAAESSIIELKLELGNLQSHADEMGIEAQNISQLLATEVASGEKLAKEVSSLRLECSKFKNDLEELKESKLSTSFIIGETTKQDKDQCSEVLHNRWLKGLLDMEDKIRELQNKSCYGFNERDFMPFNSDLDALIGILQDLKQGNGHAISAINLTSSKGNGETMQTADGQLLSGTKLDTDFYQSEGMLHSMKISTPVPQQYDSTDAHNAMKDKIFELLRELDELKAEREGLARKMGQMECYYEALVQELEESQRQMMGELQNLRNEQSTCLYTLSATKAELDKIKQDMSKQRIGFAEEKCNLESLNKDLERRAVTAEAALKRVRLNYSIAVNQLQKDLELLSSQVLSMYETNDDLIKQAFSDSLSASRLGCEEMTQNSKLEAKDFHAVEPLQHLNQNDGLKKQCMDGQIFSEDLKRSIFLQKGLCQKVEEEIYEVHLVNVYLDVFSQALQETLLEATSDFRLMKDLVNELKQQLQLSNESKDLLMMKLQSAVDEVRCLKEYRDACDAKCNDMALQNQVLEANIQNVTHEKCILSQKITEYEPLVKELVSYQNKFEACFEEKLELEILFQKERLENDSLQNKICLLQKEMETIQTDLNELASVKGNLQKTVDFVHDKMCDLLASYDENLKGSVNWSQWILEDIESKDLAGIFLQLEQFQHSACKKIFQLMEEKQVLVQERDTAQVSLHTVDSDNLLMKEKFEHDVQNIMHKLDVSTVLVQRLQSEVEAIANRLKISSEAEKDYAQIHRELLSDYDHLEVELQQLTSKNKDLAKEIMTLEKVTEELGRCKIAMEALLVDKETLMMSVKDKTEESAKLARELSNSISSYQSLHDEIQDERSSRGRLESTVADLTAQLNEKQYELLHFNQQQADLDDLKQLVSNLEMENSRLKCSLLDSEECLKTAREECSSFSSLNRKFCEMHEVLIAMDVRHTFTRTQCEAVIQDLNQQLCSSDMYVAERQKKFLDVQKKLDCCLANEAHYVEENARLMENLNSLKTELDASIAENKALLDKNSVMKTEIEKCKEKSKSMEGSSHVDRSQQALEVEKLELMLTKSQEVIDNMTFSKEELDVQCLIFKVKLHELQPQIALLEEIKHELAMLQKKYNELTHRFSEQVLKTEEFKNLSIHLKELKNKADAEYHQTHQKREPEEPAFAVQESLRIAFIKEQYETKLQELKHQLSMSQRQCAEMLLKFQDAVDEVENRKKSEFTHLKRNEELGMRILELEFELHSALSEKHEILKACDLMKAEKECSLISLQYCKEEKQELEASLQICNEERSKIAAELTSVKDLLETSVFLVSNQARYNGGLHATECKANELANNILRQKNPISDSPSSGRTDEGMLLVKCSIDSPLDAPSDQDILQCRQDVNSACSNRINQADDSNVDINMQTEQDALVSRGVNRRPSQEDILHDGNTPLVPVTDSFKAQNLKSSIDHLHNELERMKHDDLFLCQEGHAYENIPGMQRELVQLHKVNEELGSIFPSFNEFSSGGNALERVLALEIELAEALQTKKKSSINFQSSFLKQHSDEAAIFQSFKDINELIKDMLELKGKYAAVETELKEMHDRYSQLSLQFAEVEGERQKLTMTLKNVRGSKKLPYLNRSSTDPFGDLS